MRNRPYCYSKVVNISVFKMIARVSSIIEHSVESFTRNQIKFFISFVRGRTSDASHLLMVFFSFSIFMVWFLFRFRISYTWFAPTFSVSLSRRRMWSQRVEKIIIIDRCLHLFINSIRMSPFWNKCNSKISHSILSCCSSLNGYVDFISVIRRKELAT